MKIEVEFSEMERLRSQVKEQERTIKRLEDQITELGEEKLKERAVRLSYRLFDKYVSAIFAKLGFDKTSWEGTVKFEGNLQYVLGKDWWNKAEDLTVEIGATVTENFRSAFLNIGVVPKEKLSEPEELKL
jgi:uncharacterized coiled-coil protein SlyX